MKVISIHVDPVATAEKLRFPWYTDLVGGIPTPLKNMSSSDWIIIPTIGKNKLNAMFQTTKQWYTWYWLVGLTILKNISQWEAHIYYGK